MTNHSTARAYKLLPIACVAIALAGGNGCADGGEPDTLVDVSSAITADSPSRSLQDHHHRRPLSLDYVADCNDPESASPLCVHPSEDVVAEIHANGYPYYIGHAEPVVKFFSTAANSGSNLQWKIRLPATDPTPTQNGSSIANFELSSAHWISMALCDPTSEPYGGCTAASDSNNPLSAGAAFMELQLLPPGAAFGGVVACSTTQWCAILDTFSLHRDTTFAANQCLESGNAQFVTRTGSISGTKLLMSSGDSLLVTVHDTSSGLRVDIGDQTAGRSGFMVMSGANNFRHNTSVNNTNGICSTTTTTQCTANSDCPGTETCLCRTTPFDFHALYATASPSNVVRWSGPFANVAYSVEIGHWELCGDASCSVPPDGGDDSSFCFTDRGIGGCSDEDTDMDGVSFQANWPDGSASHPAPVIIGSSNNTGVGPLSASPTNASSYVNGFDTIAFVAAGPSPTKPGVAFYPFFSAAGWGTSCRFNFGNDIPGVTADDFSQRAQYTGLSRNNPCFPGAPAWVAPLVSQALF